jgi:hypothetical protein
MTPASRDAKNNPQSSLRRFFNQAVEQVDRFLSFMDEVSLEHLQAFWGRRKFVVPTATNIELMVIDARSQLILIGNFLVYLFLLSSSLEEVRATYKQLEHFHESLQKKCELVDEGSLHLIRPVALRIDSFFTQTAQIMRRSLTAAPFSEGSSAGTPL